MKGVALMFVLAAVAMVALGVKWSVVAHLLMVDAGSGWRDAALLGWAVLALSGAWYHATPAQADTAMARAHLAIGTTGGVLLLAGAATPAGTVASGLTLSGALAMVCAVAILMFRMFGARGVRG